MGVPEEVIDSVETAIAILEASVDVAYAEVGGVERRCTDSVVSTTRTDSSTGMDTWGVWWRLFASGGADYRFLTHPTSDELETGIKRSIRAAVLLDHDCPPHYDAVSTHRAVDPGWTPPEASLTMLDPGEKAESVRDAVKEAIADRPIDRMRVEYADEYLDQVLLTTTGTALRTSVERASIDATVSASGRFKGRQHHGTTTGCRLLESVPLCLDSLAERTIAAATTPTIATPPVGRRTVALSPIAAAQLIHQFCHYLEIDTCYIGMSPYRLGDIVGPPTLTISDEVVAGSWSSCAFDAEGTHARPVTLVDNGRVVARLHSIASAIEEDVHPNGNVIQCIGFEHPPRVHARQLTVTPGSATRESLLDGADLYVERFGVARHSNEATRTKRFSGMPPSVLYAKAIKDQTPATFSSEAENQRVELSLDEAYTVSGTDPSKRIRNAVYVFDPTDVTTIAAIGRVSETHTGVCVKHKSSLPYAVTAPGIRLQGDLRSATE